MRDVLIVDDDVGTLDGFIGVLEEAGFAVRAASTLSVAFEQIEQRCPDVVLADLRLSHDESGLDLLRRARHTGIKPRIVVVTGFGSSQSAVEAIRLGAVDYVEKPLVGDALLQVIDRALRNAPCEKEQDANLQTHAAGRFVSSILPVLHSQRDIPTIAEWSRCAGVSKGALKGRCLAISVSPKNGLNLARLLRAVLNSHEYGQPAVESLDVVDRRTLASLLKRGGVASGHPEDLPSDIDTFLDRQRFVLNVYALRELRRRVA